jgi:hypothetical protein
MRRLERGQHFFEVYGRIFRQCAAEQALDCLLGIPNFACECFGLFNLPGQISPGCLFGVEPVPGLGFAHCPPVIRHLLRMGALTDPLRFGCLPCHSPHGGAEAAVPHRRYPAETTERISGPYQAMVPKDARPHLIAEDNLSGREAGALRFSPLKEPSATGLSTAQKSVDRPGLFFLCSCMLRIAPTPLIRLIRLP